MSSKGNPLWVARKKPAGHLISMTEKGSLIVPGVTDPLELRDLLQAALEKWGLTWQDWNKYLEQEAIDQEYREKRGLVSLEWRRRREGQVPRKVEKYIPRRVI